MRLPNAHQADLGTKHEDYSLNPLHREGQHKARVFRSVLGITLENADFLRDAILEAAVTSEEVEARGDNGFGSIFVLRFFLKMPSRHTEVLTAWIIRHGEDFPRLTTCYIL